MFSDYTEPPIHSSADMIALLSTRLTAAERALEELKYVQSHHAKPAPYLRVMTVSVLVMIFIAAFISGQLHITHAQDMGQRVKAPFVVVDGRGQTMFRVTEDSTGRGATLFSSSGRPVAGLSSSPAGSGAFVAANGDGTTVAALGANGNGDGGLEIHDKSEKMIADIARDSVGARGIAIYGEDGKVRGALGSDEEQTPYLNLSLSEKRNIFNVWATEDSSALAIDDPRSGKTVVSLGKMSEGADKNKGVGDRGLAVYGDDGTLRVALGSDPTDYPYLTMMMNNRITLAALADETSNYLSLGDPETGRTVATLGKSSDGIDAKTGNALPAKPRLNLWSSTGAHIIKMGENTFGKASIIAGENIPDSGEAAGANAALGVTDRGPAVVVREVGQVRAGLSYLDGSPRVDVIAPSGTTVAELTTGKNGGVLEITDMTGFSVVEAGAFEQGVGMVRAFPLHPGGAGLLPMPGTYIKGHKGSSE